MKDLSKIPENGAWILIATLRAKVSKSKKYTCGTRRVLLVLKSMGKIMS